MNISEDTFKAWSQGPGKTEAEKCENAETAIRKAIAADTMLSAMDISVFPQGSYRSRTNVRQDSDVDICVRYNEAFFPEYPEGTTRETFGNISGKLPFADFKNMVETALKNYFGAATVKRGKKAFDVHANTYRIDADVVPTFEHRRYTGKINNDGSHHYFSGVAFNPDDGGLIINWPEQTYNNGINRNDVTGRKYKRVIRLLKRLRNEMQSERISDSAGIASFLIECLVWNASVDVFNQSTFTEILRHVVTDLWSRTRKDEDCSQWVEVNQLKYLFHQSQPWTREQSNKFLVAAWNYVGFK